MTELVVCHTEEVYIYLPEAFQDHLVFKTRNLDPRAGVLVHFQAYHPRRPPPLPFERQNILERRQEPSACF